jgi:nicotinate-nucleotide adenylyltransferase
VFESKQNDSRPLALYGLAANPPHRRHWDCVKWLVERGFNVLVAPSFAHAFGKDMAPFEQRARWLEEAGQEFEALGAHACVWTREREVAQSKPLGQAVYSIEMLDEARQEFGQAPRLAIGPDNGVKEVFAKFRSHERILSEFGVIAMPNREGDRSTAIRDRLRHEGAGAWLAGEVGHSIAPSVARHFAPPAPKGVKCP